MPHPHHHGSPSPPRHRPSLFTAGIVERLAVAALVCGGVWALIGWALS